MGEQGSLQVADGHVADVATRVTAHASHSLGGEGRERRRGKGEGIRGRGREVREGAGMYQQLTLVHTIRTSVCTSRL